MLLEISFLEKMTSNRHTKTEIENYHFIITVAITGSSKNTKTTELKSGWNKVTMSQYQPRLLINYERKKVFLNREIWKTVT